MTSCIRYEVWIITRFQKLNLRFQTKCRVPPFLTEEKVETYYCRLILVVYLNRSLVAEITVPNNSTLNSPQAWIEIRWGLRFDSAQLRCEVEYVLRYYFKLARSVSRGCVDLYWCPKGTNIELHSALQSKQPSKRTLDGADFALRSRQTSLGPEHW